MADHLALADVLALVGRLDDRVGPDAPRERFRWFLTTRATDLGSIKSLLTESLGVLGEQPARARQDLVAALGRFLGFDVAFGQYRDESGAVMAPGFWQSPRNLHIAIDVRSERDLHADADGLIRGMETLASLGAHEGWFGLVVLTPFYVMRRSLEESLAARDHEPVRSISLESLLWLAELCDAGRLGHEDVVRLLTASPGGDFMVDLMRRLTVSAPAPEASPAPPVWRRASANGLSGPRLAIVARSEPGVRRCWVAVLMPDATDAPEQIVQPVIRRRQLLGVSGDGNTHADARIGDRVCLVARDTGVVGHAVLDASIEEPASVVRGADRFAAVFRLTEVAIFDAPEPVPDSCETRRVLDALPPASGALLRRISHDEYDALTRSLPDDRPAAGS